eukprot:1771-Heterococcus_DN1.PRE.2
MPNGSNDLVIIYEAAVYSSFVRTALFHALRKQVQMRSRPVPDLKNFEGTAKEFCENDGSARCIRTMRQ